MSELRDLRLDHLEEEVREIKTVLGRPEPLIKAAEAAPPRPWRSACRVRRSQRCGVEPATRSGPNSSCEAG